MDKSKRIDILKFCILVLFFISIIVVGFLFIPKIKPLLADFNKVRTLIEPYGAWSYIIFFLLQILQVVIFVIPGDIINSIGGFLFGIAGGAILSITGVIVGSIISFYIARLLGYNFVNRFIKKEKIEKLTQGLNSHAGGFGLFIFCNIPFVPKDILMYCAGLTPCKARRILTVYCLSRIPGIIIWTSVGANVYDKNVLGLVITFLVLILFLASIVLIKKKMDKKKIKVIESKNIH